MKQRSRAVGLGWYIMARPSALNQKATGNNFFGARVLIRGSVPAII
ncbi:MAG: hypothetical protein ACFCD0_09785 [Gemmataceae bacterium]